MKTAILKTDMWDDDAFFELNIDTKLLYLLIMSAPERGISNIYRVSDRMLSFRSGLNTRQLEVCKQQLEERHLVLFKDGFVYLTDSCYVKPTRGRLTKTVMARELAAIPSEIMSYFEVPSTDDLVPEEHMKSTGTVQVHNDRDNNNDKDNHSDVDKAVTRKPEIDELFETWADVVGYPIESQVKKNRYACSNLLKKHGRDKVEALLRGVAASQADKYSGVGITDFFTLQSNLSKLLAWGKRSDTSSKVAVIS